MLLSEDTMKIYYVVNVINAMKQRVREKLNIRGKKYER